MSRDLVLDAISKENSVVFADADISVPIEVAILGIWKDETWVEDIKIDDDFFSIGGDSLAAVRVMIRLRDTFGIDIPISQLLETPVLRDFAKHVENLRVSGSFRPQAAGEPPLPDMEEGTV